MLQCTCMCVVCRVDTVLFIQDFFSMQYMTCISSSAFEKTGIAATCNIMQTNEHFLWLMEFKLFFLFVSLQLCRRWSEAESRPPMAGSWLNLPWMNWTRRCGRRRPIHMRGSGKWNLCGRYFASTIRSRVIYLNSSISAKPFPESCMNTVWRRTWPTKTSSPSGRSPDTRTCVVCVAYRSGTPISAPTVFAVSLRPSWRKARLWNVSAVAVAAALVDKCMYAKQWPTCTCLNPLYSVYQFLYIVLVLCVFCVSVFKSWKHM